MGVAVELIGKIRKRMKERGITYKDMAKRLGISEPSLKRSFSKTLFTIERIDEMCAVLNLSLEELGKPDLSTFQVEFLTAEQEEYLAADEKLFVVFYLIVSGFTFDAILNHFSFEKPELQKVFLNLDKLNLIKLFENNRTMPCVDQGIWWDLEGPLSKKYGDMIRTDFFDSHFNKANEHAWLTGGNISRESLKTLQKKQDKVVAAFKELVELDHHLPTAEKINLTFMAGLRPWTLPPVLKYRKK